MLRRAVLTNYTLRITRVVDDWLVFTSCQLERVAMYDFEYLYPGYFHCKHDVLRGPLFIRGV